VNRLPAPTAPLAPLLLAALVAFGAALEWRSTCFDPGSPSIADGAALVAAPTATSIVGDLVESATLLPSLHTSRSRIDQRAVHRGPSVAHGARERELRDAPRALLRWQLAHSTSSGLI